MVSKKKTRIIKLLKTEYVVGDKVPASAIYECSECENITAFRKGEIFLPCEEDHSDEDQHWYRTNQFIHFVSKNLNDEFRKIETFGERTSDTIAEFAGSWIFIISFFIFLAAWMYINVHLLWIGGFDPYPFILLNLILSTIAAIQAPLILMSQNRQEQRGELRAELDYQTNLRTEKEVAEILSMIKELRDEGKIVTTNSDDDDDLSTKEKHQHHKTKRRAAKHHKVLLKQQGIDHINV